MPHWTPVVPALALLATFNCGSNSTRPSDSASPPPPSAGHALVYDDSLGAVILVNAGLGGMNDAQRANQKTAVWAWKSPRWELVDSSGPPLRNLAGVAYDVRRNALVIHGGSSVGGTAYAETWEWKAGSRNLRGTGGPGARDHTAMAYDENREVSVLFSGQVTVDSFPRDTWEWDGTSWTLVHQGGPAPRVHHAMAYDPVRKKVMLFGGYQPNVADLGDLWSWDGAGWQPVGNSAPRTHAALVFHEELQELAAIAGRPGPALSLWRNGSWVAPAGAVPPPRYLPGAAFDRDRGVLVVFGGGNPAGPDLRSGTWEHDGTRWRRIASP